ncbi:Septum formation initiator [Gracilinema caldarium DSM 7334]|uniref:Septum formation initiator n=2 Tax=Gracilinema caldarium TaxID=215591 RepID=F8F2P8_GRAC1|nr:Septum formation initiator [Gracilinema caldarium DSM 7334]
MKLRYVMLSIWVTVAIYSLGSFCYGPTGILAMNHLIQQKEKLSTNIEQLGILQQNLSYSVNALLYDRDTIEVLARDLGYGKSDELFIRISSTESINKSRYIVGGLVIPEAYTPPLHEVTLRIIAIASGFIILILTIILGRTLKTNKATSKP